MFIYLITQLAALMKENGFNVGKAKHILVSDLQGRATRLLAIGKGAIGKEPLVGGAIGKGNHW